MKGSLLSKWDELKSDEVALEDLRATWERDLPVPPLPTADELKRALDELEDTHKRNEAGALYSRMERFQLRYVNLGDPGCLRHLCGQAQVLCFVCHCTFAPIDKGKVKQHEKSKKHVMGMMAYHAAIKAGHEANFRAQQSMSPAVAQLYQDTLKYAAAEMVRRGGTYEAVNNLIHKPDILREVLQYVPLDVMGAKSEEAVSSVWKEMQGNIEALLGKWPYSILVDEGSTSLLGGKYVMVIMVKTAFMKAVKVVSTIPRTVARNAEGLRKELDAVVERFKKWGLPVAIISDNGSVPLSAILSLIEDNGVTLQMKCIAHSVQLCLRHFFTQWNDIIEFLAAMRS
ncbi:MAG: hypothetical protein EON60_14130, partial [Alphaproteobacteria bacterium]